MSKNKIIKKIIVCNIYPKIMPMSLRLMSLCLMSLCLTSLCPPKKTTTQNNFPQKNIEGWLSDVASACNSNQNQNINLSLPQPKSMSQIARASNNIPQPNQTNTKQQSHSNNQQYNNRQAPPSHFANPQTNFHPLYNKTLQPNQTQKSQFVGDYNKQPFYNTDSHVYNTQQYNQQYNSQYNTQNYHAQYHASNAAQAQFLNTNTTHNNIQQINQTQYCQFNADTNTLPFDSGYNTQQYNQQYTQQYNQQYNQPNNSQYNAQNYHTPYHASNAAQTQFLNTNTPPSYQSFAQSGGKSSQDTTDGYNIPEIYSLSAEDLNSYNGKIFTFACSGKSFKFYANNSEGRMILLEIKKIYDNIRGQNKFFKPYIIKKLERLAVNFPETHSILKQIVEQA